jgi:hypothetical protein
LLPDELPPPPVALLLLPVPVLPGLLLVPLVPPGALGLLVELPPLLGGGMFFSLPGLVLFSPAGLLPLLPVPPLPVPPLLFCGHPIATASAAAPTSAIQLFRVVMSSPSGTES